MCPPTAGKLSESVASGASVCLLNMVPTKPLSRGASYDSLAESFETYYSQRKEEPYHSRGSTCKIEDLDTTTLTTILLHLRDTRDVYSFGLTCKSFYSVLQDQFLWRTMVEERFKIPVWLARRDADFKAMYATLHEGAVDSSNAYSECLELAKQDPDKRSFVHVTPPSREGFIRFTGYKTDGGIDNEDNRYWVNNMFSPSPWEAYCSQASRNIHCLAYLDSKLCIPSHRIASDGYDTDSAKTRERDYMIDRVRAVASTLFDPNADDGGRPSYNTQIVQQPPALETWSTTELEVFLSEIWEIYNQGFPLGQLLFHGVHQSQMASEVARVRRTVTAIERRRDIASRGVVIDSSNRNNLWLKMSAPPPCFEYEDRVAVSHVNCLKISRRGQFSCPVQVGVVLLGVCLRASQMQDVDPASQPVCQAFNDLESEESVVAASEKGLLPKIVKCHKLPAGIIIEFEASMCSRRKENRVDGELFPCIWFRFDSKREDGSRSLTDRALEQDELDVLLASDGHIGNITCAKLIASENMMSEYEDLHEDPNIDANFIGMRGSVVIVER